jgi:hypothetical protein
LIPGSEFLFESVGVNMECMEGSKLKEVALDKIEDYLSAEHAQYTCSNFEEEDTRLKAEMAHAALAEARRRYWQHIKMHNCDTAAILAVEPGTLDSIAV